MKSIYIALLVLSILSACGGGGGGSNGASDDSEAVAENPSNRSFSMGFTPWLYDDTIEALNFVYGGVKQQGDIISFHLDNGIPWQEAYDQSPYPDAFENDLSLFLSNAEDAERIFLTVSPFNTLRTDIAEYWGSGTPESLQTLWAARNFDSPEVIQAYSHFASDLIGRFNPDYFNFGLEASELAINDAAKFDAFVTFAAQVSANLKQDYPELPLMVSVALKSPGSDQALTIENLVPDLLPYVDMVGVSVYPYMFFDHADKGDPVNLPSDWLAQIRNVAGGKPIAISETGWIAERFTGSYEIEGEIVNVDVMANALNQRDYLSLLFEEAQNLNAEFIIWFLLVDFDALWDKMSEPDKNLARIWRDTGLYDENLMPRASLQVWNERFEMTKDD